MTPSGKLLVSPDNTYTRMQREYYDATAANMAATDHRGHNSNPDYYGLLLSDIQPSEKWSEKVALDFGCGTGRNVGNLLKQAVWKEVIGVDLSALNLSWADDILRAGHHSRFSLIQVNGVDLQPIESDSVDFLMSTIVLQHIPVWSIRHQLLHEFFRVLRPGGEFSFQMAMQGRADYYADFWDAFGTNGDYDVAANRPGLEFDLSHVGFQTAKFELRPSWDYIAQRYTTDGSEWIYVKTWKPNTFSTSSTH